MVCIALQLMASALLNPQAHYGYGICPYGHTLTMDIGKTRNEAGVLTLRCFSGDTHAKITIRRLPVVALLLQASIVFVRLHRGYMEQGN
jgi:hypothetical protein